MAENQITNIKLNFICSENWDNMTPAENGRHCDKCNKTVHDFTNSKVEEFRAIMAENNNSICGRFRKEQIAPVILPRWKKWVSAALVVIGLGFLSKKADAQTNNLKIKDTTSSSHTEVHEIFGGVDEVLPEFPGGYEKFKAFLAKNLNPEKSAKPCRVTLVFTVEKNGSLSNIKPVGRVEDPKSVKEAIRVMKLSPKWIPGKRSGKAVRLEQSIPIVFS